MPHLNTLELPRERRTVSYTVNQYHSTAGYNAPAFVDKHGAAHLQDIADNGFDEVVIAVSELDLKLPERMDILRGLAETAGKLHLLVTADLWTFYKATGGEAISFAAEEDKEEGLGNEGACTCNPNFKKLFVKGIRKVAAVGIGRMLWDEVGLTCPNVKKHSDVKDNFSRAHDFIDELSQIARAEGIAWNSSCVRPQPDNLEMIDEVASMSAIDEIAVSPYPFHPASKKKEKPHDEIIDDISYSFTSAKASADRHDIEAQAWVQGFNIAPKNMDFMRQYVNEITKAGIGNMALWSYLAGADIIDLNLPGSSPPAEVWEMSCGLMRDSRSGLIIPRRLSE